MYREAYIIVLHYTYACMYVCARDKRNALTRIYAYIGTFIFLHIYICKMYVFLCTKIRVLRHFYCRAIMT